MHGGTILQFYITSILHRYNNTDLLGDYNILANQNYSNFAKMGFTIVT